MSSKKSKFVKVVLIHCVHMQHQPVDSLFDIITVCFCYQYTYVGLLNLLSNKLPLQKTKHVQQVNFAIKSPLCTVLAFELSQSLNLYKNEIQ